MYMWAKRNLGRFFLLLVVGQPLILCGCHKAEKLSGYNMPPPVFKIEAEKKVIPQEEERSEDIDYSDFNRLCRINSDTVGWLFIPGTKINYPIVQTTDNDKYLHTGFNGEDNVAGTIFLDYESDSDLMGKNNILYGHNMKNGTMFRDLVQFKNKEFFEEHKYFQIYTMDRVISLKAISCYYGKADAGIRQTKFNSQGEYEVFIERIIKKCEYAEIPDKPVKSIYTLITCSYEMNDARTYLIAVEE